MDLAKLQKKYTKKYLRGLQQISKLEKTPKEAIVADAPTHTLLFLHYSDSNEAQFSTLQKAFRQFGTVKSLIMIPGVNYGYLEYETVAEAEAAKEALNELTCELPFPGKAHGINVFGTQLPYSSFSITRNEAVPEHSVPGLEYIPGFLTEEEDAFLVEQLSKWEWTKLTNRHVVHFGYNFRYGSNDYAHELMDPIPEFLNPLLDRLEERYGIRFDQITANDYQPGDSIPPHIDSHAPFEETLVSISLMSGVSMRWESPEGKIQDVWLEKSSLAAYSGEARYTWKHSISQRKYDIINRNSQFRQRRISLTFRKTREGPYTGKFSTVSQPEVEPELELGKLEDKYVYEVYDEIADHFSDTRYKGWPKVEAFLQKQPENSFVIDVGCGNGKYLSCRQGNLMLGTDRSPNLLKIWAERQFHTFVADCMSLPVRSNMFDVAISIAVVHHLSTPAMRLQAVSEIARVLSPGGVCLVYVWAKEQSERTFTKQDNLVPWVKQNKTYQRFYHVFVEGELEDLMRQVDGENGRLEILETYYDKANWCVIAKKV